ncbi:MAG: sulfide/dihydroorotate dehydrogenase-like FAD/NAD-binding protein [Clostridiaceae bacterium]|nr:sulfide/dihydroorotate dehydrogenase-like FAD/NAD-binding protein [Clostridiaceae bacterium]
MYKIMKKRLLNPQVVLMDVYAPRIAKSAKAGQFIILRVDEKGERIPLTIADYNVETGNVTIIFQIVGKTTLTLAALSQGDSILDFVGPLGVPSHFESVKKAAVIGGGLGLAIAYPQAKALHNMGTEVDFIAGFRNKDLIFLEDEINKVSKRTFIATDDGSAGIKGFVTDVLKKLIEQGEEYDVVIAIGPLVMMKAVSELTKKYKIKTTVSLNPIMIDGTGMCGGCRVTVDGKTKFACVDGPEFDGHLVDFDEAIARSGMYKEIELNAVNKHKCKMEGIING